MPMVPRAAAFVLFAATAATGLGGLAVAACGSDDGSGASASTAAGGGGAGGSETSADGGAGGVSAGGSRGDGGSGGTRAAGGSSGDGGAGGSGGGGAPPSSVPSDPIHYTKNDPFTVDSGTTNWVYVPTAYDDSHQTPITLLIWLHGCGGESSGDVWTASPGGAQSWITLAVGGREGGCWDVNHDTAYVLDALADIKTHFNIAPKHVVLGGYSSGGDLSYRTAFYNAGLFAGLIIENSSPYRDTGSSQAMSLAAASWKFNVAHLAHLQDDTYKIAGVRTETESMIAAGFPLKRIEVDGGHYDNAGAMENGHSVPGTSADLRSILLPYLDKGWTAP